MKKQVFIFSLALLLTFVLSATVFAAEIGTPAELASVMQDSEKWGESYILTSDIDMSGAKQSPIGTYAIPFTGEFDGAGHTISGLDITSDFTVGLFGVVEGATIKNVTVKGTVNSTFEAENAETKKDGKYPGVGGLVGVVLTGSTIEKCVGEVTVNAPGNCGALIGHVYNFGENATSITECENYGTVNSTLGNIGGVIGRIFVDSDAENAVVVKGCINHAEVTTTSEDRARLGGVIGYIRTLDGVVDVIECKNLGTVNGSNSGAKASNYPYVGGIVGRCEVATGATAAICVRNSLNLGEIISTQVGGGIVGYMSRGDACVTNESGVFGSVNTANVSGGLCAAGILGYSEGKALSKDAKSIVKGCVNTGAVTSPASAAGIVARHFGFDVVECVSIGEVTSETLFGGLVSDSCGDTFCEVSDSYYVNDNSFGNKNDSCIERDTTKIDLAKIEGDERFAKIDFATASVSDEIYAIAAELYPAVTEATEETTTVTETDEVVLKEKDGNVLDIICTVFAIIHFVLAVACAIVLVMLIIRKNNNTVLKVVSAVLCAVFLIGGVVLFNVGGGESAGDDVTEAEGLPDPSNIDVSGDFNFLIAGNWAWNDYAYADENRTVVDDAIYKRNEAIKQKYGINITNEDIVEYASSMGQGSGYRKLYTEYMAGYTNYDAAMIGTYDVASLAYNGFLVDLNTVPYLDLTKDYWDQKANEDLSMNGKMYYTTGEISLMDNRSVYTLFFSKGMVEEYGLENPYDLVTDNKWTLEKFAEMIKKVGFDSNQDGIYDKNDTFGLMTPTDTHLAILAAAREKIGSVNDKGQIEITLYNERTDRLYDRYLDIVTDHANTYNYQYNYQTGATGLQSSNEDRVSMFNNFQALFYSHTMFYTDELRAIDNDFGILPYPKLDETQEEYGNLVSAWHSQFLCVPMSNRGLTRIGIVLEELAITGKEYLTPAYYEKTLQGKYVRDAESAKMLDVIFDSLVFDIGAYYNLGTYKDQLGAMPRTGQSLTVIYETYLPMAQNKVNEINAFFEKNTGV